MIQKRGRLVVKFGTESLLGKSGKTKGRLDQKIFCSVAEQVARLQDEGIDVTIVSSGAIKSGKEHLSRLGANPNHLKLEKKDLAGIGARHLLNRWGYAFELHQRSVAQVWVTYGNWECAAERRSIRSSILKYHCSGVIPIINENDVVSDKEIKLMEQGISENDQLARMVAELIEADAVLFITNVGGVYGKDPRVDPCGDMYKEIDRETIISRMFDSSSGASLNGIGGMRTKLTEALNCFNAGMRVAIAGMSENVITEFALGRPVGTMLGRQTKLIKCNFLEGGEDSEEKRRR